MPHAHSLLAPSHEAVLSKALFAAVRRLGISRTAMQKIMGMSDSTLRRIEKGSASLTANPKAYELGVLLIRLYRSLDAIAGGEESTVKSWMQSENTVLGGDARCPDSDGGGTGACHGLSGRPTRSRLSFCGLILRIYGGWWRRNRAPQP
ncbi:hypothetical protein JCM17843_29940 [Kordiimonadales bacterium JCM 17843]|nr:hypothetical protein JCM17843_29940 [Kordiimonadales bacterium JCM 17843]